MASFRFLFQPVFPALLLYVLATLCARLAGYHCYWELRPGFPSSDHYFHVVKQTTRAESLWKPSLTPKYIWKPVCQLILRWLQCGTAMSGPRTAAWQGHGKMRCRGNWCCKHCKAEHHFVQCVHFVQWRVALCTRAVSRCLHSFADSPGFNQTG